MSKKLTPDELVETLKRSSLTTVLVEGKDDMLIYRWIEEEIGIENASFLSCNGRENLIRVFKRRDEFSHIKTIFIADKDCFVYDCTPIELDEIIWTEGYSIENDLYFGQNLEKLMDINEDTKFRVALKNFISYYAFEVEQYQKKIVYNFATHPNQCLDSADNLDTTFLTSVNFTDPDPATIKTIEDNYQLLLRGKSLFALLLRYLSYSSRSIKHSRKSLIEHSFKLHRSGLIDKMIEQLNERLYA